MITNLELALRLAGGQAVLSAGAYLLPVASICPAPPVACAIAMLSKALDEYGELGANLLNPPSAATTSTGWVSLNLTGF
jgi:hypothetical protein